MAGQREIKQVLLLALALVAAAKFLLWDIPISSGWINVASPDGTADLRALWVTPVLMLAELVIIYKCIAGYRSLKR